MIRDADKEFMFAIGEQFKVEVFGNDDRTFSLIIQSQQVAERRFTINVDRDELVRIEGYLHDSGYLISGLQDIQALLGPMRQVLSGFYAKPALGQSYGARMYNGKVGTYADALKLLSADIEVNLVDVYAGGDGESKLFFMDSLTNSMLFDCTGALITNMFRMWFPCPAGWLRSDIDSREMDEWLLNTNFDLGDEVEVIDIELPDPSNPNEDVSIYLQAHSDPIESGRWLIDKMQDRDAFLDWFVNDAPQKVGKLLIEKFGIKKA